MKNKSENKHAVIKMVDEVMCVGMDHSTDGEVRAKLYRKAGLELVALAAQMEAELLFAD